MALVRMRKEAMLLGQPHRRRLLLPQAGPLHSSHLNNGLNNVYRVPACRYKRGPRTLDNRNDDLVASVGIRPPHRTRWPDPASWTFWHIDSWEKWQQENVRHDKGHVKVCVNVFPLPVQFIALMKDDSVDTHIMCERVRQRLDNTWHPCKRF